jgi:hypothetical protein
MIRPEGGQRPASLLDARDMTAHTNPKGPKILFFISGVLILLGLFIMKLTKAGLRIKFFIAESLFLPICG